MSVDVLKVLRSLYPVDVRSKEVVGTVSLEVVSLVIGDDAELEMGGGSP